MTPDFRIGGLLAAATDRITEVRLSDQQGGKSDELTLTLDDRDFNIPIPRNAATLTVAIGYVETGLVHKGTYKVDSMRIRSAPYEVKITAKAVDVHGKFKEIGYASYKDKTIKEIVEDIARRNGYPAVVSSSLADHKLDFEAMAGESGMHFLTRLAERYDATFKVAEGKVLFVERGELRSASGKVMSPLIVTWGNLIDYSAQVSGRPKHGRGRGRGWDRDGGVEIKDDVSLPVSVGESTSPVRGGPAAEARYPVSNKSEGRRRARGRANSSRRSSADMSVTIIGNPYVTSETPVVVVGVREGLNGIWRAKNVTHHISGKQYFSTKIECERPNAGADKKATTVPGQSLPVAVDP